MCRLRNIAMHDYQESATTRQTDRQTDRCQTKWSLCATMFCRRHKNFHLQLYETSSGNYSTEHFKVDPVSYDVIVLIVIFVTVTNYHFYHLFLLQIQQIRMSFFMKFEQLFLHKLKIIGKEHDFLQDFPYIFWRIMHKTIFNQKQVLQGTIIIIYSNCKYNKLYVCQILWSLNHYL